MGAPLPPEIQLPDGRTGYLNPYRGTYTPSRSYALRMQRGYARGLSQGDARGKRVTATGQTEYQRRAAATQERYGMSPWQLRYGIGFERRYGFKYRYWRKLQRMYVNDINARSSPGGAISPSTVGQVKENWRVGFRDQFQPDLRGPDDWEPWIERRLSEKLDDMISYQDLGEKANGAYHFGYLVNVMPIELWYYH